LIFIDTGAFVARYVKRDQYHSEAVRFWHELDHLSERLFTSNFVLDEAFTLLARRAGYQFASERARNIYESKVLVILRPDRDDELKALVCLEKYADQKISFTDCVSFALMKQRRIKRVFSFDHHFERAGFTKLP
jgi:predicted nucleic acid-binding protein